MMLRTNIPQTKKFMMKKIKAHFEADKEIWALRIYFAICIFIAILLCKYFGNIFCSNQGMVSDFTNIILNTALLMLAGGFAVGIYKRL